MSWKNKQIMPQNMGMLSMTNRLWRTSLVHRPRGAKRLLKEERCSRVIWIDADTIIRKEFKTCCQRGYNQAFKNDAGPQDGTVQCRSLHYDLSGSMVEHEILCTARGEGEIGRPRCHECVVKRYPRVLRTGPRRSTCTRMHA